MQHPVGQASDTVQTAALVKVTTQHAYAFGVQFRLMPAAATEYGDPEAPVQLLHNTHANITAPHDQQAWAAKTGGQCAKRALV